MKKLFSEKLETAINIENESEKLTYLTAILRSLLQSAVVISIEIVKAVSPSDEVDLPDLTSRFCKPTDGIPVQILDVLIPVVRSYFSKEFLVGWYEPTKQVSIPLSKQLIQWVEFRNKRPGHGVLDAPTTTEWATKTESIIISCLHAFSPILPLIKDDKSFSPLVKFENIVLATPLIQRGHPIVIMEVLAKRGKWKLKGQLLSKENAEEFTETLPENNIFNSIGLKPISQYQLVDIALSNRSYSLFHNVPVRQTDIFEGRKSELGQLKEWFDDEDSRYCLVFGDGGYGKTTLVLEMLNQLIEGQLDVKQQLPTIVSYNTAKMTKWTEEGLVHLTGISPVMDECIRDLMRFFEPVLKKEWYAITDRQLVDKAVSVLKENKLSRDDVLLIIDNTETLATAPEQVKELGAFFKNIGKLIGRVIITSRRREFVEATPIVIEGL